MNSLPLHYLRSPNTSISGTALTEYLLNADTIIQTPKFKRKISTWPGRTKRKKKKKRGIQGTLPGTRIWKLSLLKNFLVFRGNALCLWIFFPHSLPLYLTPYLIRYLAHMRGEHSWINLPEAKAGPSYLTYLSKNRKIPFIFRFLRSAVLSPDNLVF